MTTPKILVSAATGTVGGAIVAELAAAGIPARALTRDPAKAHFPAGIEPAAADLGDPASLAAAFAGIEAAFLNIVPGPDAAAHVANFLAAAKAAGVGHVVKLSGLRASADSPSAIIRMHAAADEAVRASGIPFTILRANSFHQNMLGQMEGIRSTGQFYMPMGEARQSTIDVGDIAAIAVQALADGKHAGQAYDVTGPDSLDFHEVAAILSRVLGRSVAYVPISSEAFLESLKGMGMPDAAAAPVAEIFALFATGVYADPTGDVETALGRKPRSFADWAAANLSP